MTRLLSLLLLLPALAAATPPTLENTELYTKLASDCHDVDLATWQHPTRTVLEHNKVPLERVQLCNGGHYPIFHVQMPYDPQGQTRDFFAPLYEQMRKANGKWPYAFVDSNDAQVLYISYRDNGTTATDFEFYALP
ncbi:MAG: hypothetical protein AAGC84_02435 [Pseudomonas sp.]